MFIVVSCNSSLERVSYNKCLWASLVLCVSRVTRVYGRVSRNSCLERVSRNLERVSRNSRLEHVSRNSCLWACLVQLVFRACLVQQVFMGESCDSCCACLVQLVFMGVSRAARVLSVSRATSVHGRVSCNSCLMLSRAASVYGRE